MTTPEERADESHERALRRQWTIHEGRKSNKRVGSWVNILDVIAKVENDEPLNRTERRVLAKYRDKIDSGIFDSELTSESELE